MKNVLQIWLCIVLMTVSSVSSAKIAIIVNKENQSLITQEDIARIYLGQSSQLDNGERLTPFTLSVNTSDGEYFTEHLLRKTKHQYKAYWSKLLFSGKGHPPMEISKPNELLDIIRNDQNAIGFLPLEMVDNSIEVVIIL